MTVPCALYRHFDELGTLLYTGISHSLGSRTQRHAWESEWVQFARRGSVEWFSTISAALVAETIAIQAEGPVFNRSKAVGDSDARIKAYYARRDLERQPPEMRPARLVQLRRVQVERATAAGLVDVEAIGLTQAAEYLGIDVKALRNARARDPRFPHPVGHGPRHSSLYRFEDLKSWAAQRRQGRAAS